MSMTLQDAMKSGICTFCGKDGRNMVLTCDKGTFIESLVCSKCAEKLIDLRSGNGKPKPAPSAVPAATPVGAPTK